MRTLLPNVVILAGALFAGLWAVTGCSIKEDRTVCPAYLNVSFADRESITKEVRLLGYGSAGELFRQSIDVSEHDPYWVKPVRKGFISLAAYLGMEVSSDTGRHLTIPVGNQCDSLYAFRSEVDCTGDAAYVEVALHKQFCTVIMDINKPLSGQNSIGHYRFLVQGNTCGFDLLDFSPLDGSYRFEPTVPEGERVASFRIPRQKDASMTVSVWYRMDDGTQVLVTEFPLGQYMARMNYNWNAEDLQDIYVKVDIVTGFITIGVEDWEDGYTFKFIEQ